MFRLSEKALNRAIWYSIYEDEITEHEKKIVELQKEFVAPLLSKETEQAGEAKKDEYQRADEQRQIFAKLKAFSERRKKIEDEISHNVSLMAGIAERAIQEFKEFYQTHTALETMAYNNAIAFSSPKLANILAESIQHAPWGIKEAEAHDKALEEASKQKPNSTTLICRSAGITPGQHSSVEESKTAVVDCEATVTQSTQPQVGNAVTQSTLPANSNTAANASSDNLQLSRSLSNSSSASQ